MRFSKRIAAIVFAGALSFAGIAAGPGDSDADTPEEAENGCPGVNEAQGDDGGNGQTGDTPAEGILEEVEDLLSDDDDCDDHGNASGDNGRP